MCLLIFCGYSMTAVAQHGVINYSISDNTRGDMHCENYFITHRIKI